MTITIPMSDTANAAHIHRGPVGVDGPIVVGLLPIPLSPGGGQANGCGESAFVSRSQVAEFVADPPAFYVNVHTNDFPDGAMRGQLP